MFTVTSFLFLTKFDITVQNVAIFIIRYYQAYVVSSNDIFILMLMLSKKLKFHIQKIIFCLNVKLYTYFQSTKTKKIKDKTN